MSFNTTSQQSSSVNANNMHHINKSCSVRLPTINVISCGHEHRSNPVENSIRLSCKNDMSAGGGGRNPKINYSIEREKRRSAEYRHHISSEVKNIMTQSVISGPNKLSSNDIYDMIQHGRPTKAQRKFISRIISDKRDRKNSHTVE